MSFNFAYGPVDIFQGIDFSNFLEHFAANNPYLDPNSEEYNAIQDLKPDQIPETVDYVDTTPFIESGPDILPSPTDETPVGIPIEHLIAGITGKPVLGPDGNIIEPTPPVILPPPPAAAGPATAPEEGGIVTLPTDNYADQDYVPPAANELRPENAQGPGGPGQGITSLNNSMVFERMRALARQPRDYRSYIG